MLPESLQVRLLTDLTYGKPVQIHDLRKFNEPYRTAFHVLSLAPVDKRIDLLFDLGNWHDEIKPVVQQVQGLNYEKDLSFFDEEWSEAQAVEPPIEWLWTGWLPRRHVSLIVSYAGIGKSFIVLDWLSRWLLNRPMPDGQSLNRQGDTAIFCDGEDFFQAYAERTRDWQEAGLWLRGETGIYLHRRLHKSKEYRLGNQTTKWQLIDFADPQEQDRLISLVYRRRPELLIIDSISSTFADTTFDKDVREPLGFITALTDEYNLCTILVHHYNKQQSLESRPDINNVKGAGAFTNFSRSIFTLHYEKVFDPSQVDRKRDPRILSPIKNNFAQPDPIGVWFRPLHPHGVMIEYCPVEQIYTMAAEIRGEEAVKQETLQEECADWLLSYLEKNGATSRKELIQLGKDLGYLPFTVDQARRTLGDLIGDTKGKRMMGNKWDLAERLNRQESGVWEFGPDSASEEPN